MSLGHTLLQKYINSHKVTVSRRTTCFRVLKTPFSSYMRCDVVKSYMKHVALLETVTFYLNKYIQYTFWSHWYIFGEEYANWCSSVSSWTTSPAISILIMDGTKD